MKNVMKRAWEIYRTLTGDKLAKLSMALKQAWSEIKGGVKLAELKGSEKQVEWANDILRLLNEGVDVWEKALTVAPYKDKTKKQVKFDTLKQVREFFNNFEAASEVISKFKCVRNLKDAVGQVRCYSKEFNPQFTDGREIDFIENY